MTDHRSYTHNLSSCEIKAWVEQWVTSRAVRTTRTGRVLKEHCL